VAHLRAPALAEGALERQGSGALPAAAHHPTTAAPGTPARAVVRGLLVLILDDLIPSHGNSAPAPGHVSRCCCMSLQLCSSCTTLAKQTIQSNPSSTEGSRPTTPPPQRAPPNGSTKSPEAARSPHKARHHVHSPEASPSLPSPMSLFQLGIGSPLRRQMSSPLTRSPVSRRSPEDDTAAVKEGEEDRQSTEPSSSDEADSSAAAQRRAIQDSKDVLVDRLSDLATRLSSGARFEEQEINSFHAKVDEMEQVLSAKQKALDRRKLHGRFVSHSSNKSQDEPFRATGPVTSGWLMAQLSDLSQHSITHDATKPELPELQKPFRMVKYQRPTPSTTSSDIDGRVAVEAEKLCAELSAVVTSLQARREESDARTTRSRHSLKQLTRLTSTWSTAYPRSASGEGRSCSSARPQAGEAARSGVCLHIWSPCITRQALTDELARMRYRRTNPSCPISVCS
jgi:hypothetical protein